MARPRKDANKKVEEQGTPKNKTKAKAKLVTVVDFDIFADDNVVDDTKELLAKVDMADGFKSAGDIARDYLPIPWPAFQYLLGRVGIPRNTIVEFIGGENLGKSSLLLALLYNFINYNIPCVCLNGDAKEVEANWSERLAGEDASRGKKIISRLETANIYTLNEMDKFIRNWVRIKRYELDRPIPKEVPLVVAVDSYTRLLDPEMEKVAMSVDARKKTVDVTKGGVEDISQKPGVFAKWMHNWLDLIKPLLEKENVTLFLTCGQNQNMNAGPVAMFSPEAAARNNKTRKGGTAVNGAAAYQITITKKGILKDSANNRIGNIICANVAKNSYGPHRMMDYGLRNAGFSDYDNFKQQALEMDKTFAELLLENKLFGVTCTRGLYSSDELDLHQVKANILTNHIKSNDDLMLKTASALHISGYEGVEEDDTTEGQEPEAEQ